MSSAFPLLRLPIKALHHVLYSIDYVDIVSFSLASKKTKEVVKCLNLQINDINLKIDSIIGIQIDAFRDSPLHMMWYFYPENNNDSIEPIPVYMPARVMGMRDTNPPQNIVKYRNPGLSIREWLAHFQYIFSFPKTSSLWFTREICKFDMRSLEETIEGSEILSLRFYGSCSLGCAQMAQRQFPSVRSLCANSLGLEDPSMYRNILIQNLDMLVLGDPTTSVRIGLDDLLLMNSKEVYVRSLTITDKLINRFLKHWMNGSNPRMEVVNFDFGVDRFLDKDAILKGTNHRELPLNQVRRYNRHENNITIKGGYDILRTDGTLGTVVIRQRFQGRFVLFFVWN